MNALAPIALASTPLTVRARIMRDLRPLYRHLRSRGYRATRAAQIVAHLSRMSPSTVEARFRPLGYKRYQR